MDITADLLTDVSADALYAVVSNLATYPQWLDIVSRAEPVEPVDSDGGPAWSIDLRGQIGPLRRSKRLRMVRTVGESPTAIRFERREHDGRAHSPWVLAGAISPVGEATRVQMSLHYGGTLWIPLLDRVLRDEIERSRPRLVTAARAD